MRSYEKLNKNLKITYMYTRLQTGINILQKSKQQLQA